MININVENGVVMYYLGEFSNFIKKLFIYEIILKLIKEKVLEIYRVVI